MKGLIPRLPALIIVLSVVASDLSADSFRCGRKLIKTGDSTGDVIRVCGEPRHKDRGKEKIKLNGVVKNTSVQRWYYKKNSRSLEHIVLIYQGRVKSIEVGER
jgi:hypothetical protein